MATPLLQLVTDTDSSDLSESDLIRHVEDVKRQLRDSWWRSAITRDSFAIGVCHVTSQVVGYLAQHRPVLAPARTSQWQKRVFLLETAVASAFTSLQDAKSRDLAVLSEENRDFCSKYAKLLNRLYETSQLPAQAVAVMTKVGVLLAMSWLSYDRVGKGKAVEKLLRLCTDFCSEHKSVQEFQKWPQFLLGMVQLVEKQDYHEALQCFRNVVEKCRDATNAAGDHVFFYWYAVVLIRNGLFSDAVDALDECIRANYEPVACLSLQAFANVKMQDYHAATEHLERALQIDCTHSGSLVNYSLLMEQMGNIDMQQLHLEAVLNSREGVDHGQAQKSDAADIAGTPTSFTALFEDACLASLSLSRRMSVLDTPTVHHRAALAAMENGSWHVSKNHFEALIDREGPCNSSNIDVYVAQDYVYVLLQCSLPSLALLRCEQFIQLYERNDAAHANDDEVPLLLLHLYRADAMLCLERVNDCFEYLSQTVQPKIQALMQRPSAIDHAKSKDIASCHSQLLNNLAVVTACHRGVDAGLLLLHNGLKQYPTSVVLQFNLVLLLWRKDDKATACTIWMKVRGWDSQAKHGEPKMTDEESLFNAASVCRNAAMSTSHSRDPLISEHVQGKCDGESGISARQLLYLDALILNYWHKARDCELLDHSVQYVEYLESLGTTSATR